MPATVHLLVALLQAVSSNCAIEAKRPLFECDELLAIEIEVPLKVLKRRAEDRPVLPATLRYVEANGESVEFDVEVTTRGHSRLEMCSFPPLSLLFDKKTMKGTLFARQKKLKIVLPCKSGRVYRDYLLQEYGIYKAYQVIADPAFRVRLLDITFRDADKPEKTERQVAFFIESIKEVAERTGMERVHDSSVPPGNVDARNASTYELFQYMIANTDWAKTKGPADEECCHNGKMLAPKGSATGWFVVPYDFDQSGLINARYAQPDERLGIRSVRERLFRGRCEYLPVMDDTIALFNDRRGDIETALAAGGPGAKTVRKQSEYLGWFYEIINDPEDREKSIDGRCRGQR